MVKNNTHFVILAGTDLISESKSHMLNWFQFEKGILLNWAKLVAI